MYPIPRSNYPKWAINDNEFKSATKTEYKQHTKPSSVQREFNIENNNKLLFNGSFTVTSKFFDTECEQQHQYDKIGKFNTKCARGTSTGFPT